MINVSEDTKIYVYCPAGVATGGAELLHQLVSILNDNGRDAYIVYYGEAEHKIPVDYLKYNIKIITEIEIENKPTNIEVIFEGRFDFALRNDMTQKVLWWLSVDNFFKCSTDFLSPIDLFKFNVKLGLRGIKSQLKYLIKHRSIRDGILSIRKLRKMGVLHAYQSEYAQNFLTLNNFSEMLPLKDFINDDHVFSQEIQNGKENIIVYNPKKGFEFTRKLIAAAPQFKWVALQGMSRKQLIDTLHRAKIYIDFGNHPGKDRLPRECAMNGCCIITGKQGSAGFYEDVMIPSKYKFIDSTKSINSIIERIQYTLDNYNDTIADFELYRKAIAAEKDEFISQIKRIFC